MGDIEGSLSREKLRDLRSLDSVKIRKRKGLCVVEGERSLSEAVLTRNLLYLVVSEEDKPASDLMADWLSAPGIPRYSLAQSRFREISGVKTGTGLLGVAKIPAQADPIQLQDIHGRCLLLYLDGIQEPGNVGALIRTAWALGMSGVLLGDGTADPFSNKGVRASAGGVFHLPLYCRVGKPEIEDLLQRGFSLFVAQKNGQDYRSLNYPERLILTLGNEGAGPSKWVLQSGRTVGIPLAEEVDSLNVVVAGGIIASRMIG